MLSLYIHIPFCDQKCAYCSFTSFPIPQQENNLIDNYLLALKNEINHYSSIYSDQEIKTIYIWWWTPSKIGKQNIIDIVQTILNNFNTENLEEFSIELNPNPYEEVLDLINSLNTRFKQLPRIRISFGIQSLDDKILKESWRQYNFIWIVDFLRNLQKIKQENNVFNFDFIAFGKFNTTRSWNIQLRDQSKLEFFQKFAYSHLADSFSLYTLELFEWSKWYNQTSIAPTTKNEIQDDIYEEFQILKEILLDAWYNRYEISNFSHPSKNSIHNMTYRNMWSYLWLGLGASSFFNNLWNDKAIRQTNTTNINEYLESNYIDTSKTQNLTDQDILIEEFFLKLRTNQWITNIEKFKNILTKNYPELIKNYQKQWFLTIKDKSIKLTDQWMDLSNSIIVELLENI